MKSKTHKKHPNNAGFSLVELMVVLVILAIGLLPLAIIQTRAQRDVYEAGSFTEAVKVAELQMESAKAMGYGNIPPADTGSVDGIYNYTTTVQNVGDRLDQIAVNVQWNESGNPRTVTVTNRISDR